MSPEKYSKEKKRLDQNYILKELYIKSNYCCNKSCLKEINII